MLPQVLAPHSGSHLLPDELPPLARRTLEAAARHCYIQTTAFSEFFASRGVPPFRDHRIWLGIDPPGLLERVLSDGRRSWPVWKWIHAAVKGELPVTDTVTVIAAHLTDEERMAMIYPDSGPLAVYRYELVCAYDANGPDDTVGRLRGEEALDDVLASILATCSFERLRALGEDVVEQRRKIINVAALLIALGRAARSSAEAFPEALLPLWERPPLSRLLRDGFATLTMAERERLLQRGHFDDQPVTVRTAQGPRADVLLMYGWTVIDLCPTPWAAEFVVNAVLDYEGPEPGLRTLVDVLVRMGSVASNPIQSALADKKLAKNPFRKALVEAQRALGAS